MKKATEAMSWQTLPDRLRYLMRVLKVKQKDFAKEIGVSDNYISMLVTGRRQSISEPLYRLICQTYGVSEVWLKEGLGEPFDATESESAELLRSKLSAVMEELNSTQLRQMLDDAMKQKKNTE